MASSIWSILQVILDYVVEPRLALLAFVPVVVVMVIRWRYANRRLPPVLDIQDIRYGVSSFNCVVVMIQVDGKWRPAVESDVDHLPPWKRD